MQESLTLEEYNQYQQLILCLTQAESKPSPYYTYEFTKGAAYGIIGPSAPSEATYFVPSRAMYPENTSQNFFAYFDVKGSSQQTVTLNLGNSFTP